MLKLLKKYRWLLVLILFILALLPSFYFYDKYKQTKKLLNNPKKVVLEEKTILLNKIGKLIELPKNEDPTIATVTDKKKLSSNPFFTKAENGDRAIFYTKAKRAILYRPSTNKIIEVSQINVESESKDATKTLITPEKTGISPSPSIQAKGRLVILNGTKIADLAIKEKDFILSKTTNLEVVSLGDTVGNFTENLVVSIKSGNENAASQLANLVSGKVVDLPSGEVAPVGADLLLIVGK